MITLLAYASIAIAISFLCALFKAVLVNLSPANLINLEKNSRYAKNIRQLHNNMERPLAALSVTNTLALTFGAAGAGAAAIQMIESHYLGLFLIGLGLMVVFISQILPKTIGMIFRATLAPLMSIYCSLLMTLMKPVNWIIDHLKPSEQSAPELRAEMHAMADWGEEAGVLHGDESELVKNMLKFRDLGIIEVMTPRSVLFSLPEGMMTSEYMTEYTDSGFSRIPVYRGEDPDNIDGFVMKTDILMAQNKDGGSKRLGSLKRPLMAVLENESLPKLMSRFLEKRSHIAMVVTEYGDIRGIVTLEDMIETLLGREIVDESDEAVDMQQKARDKWAHRLPANAA
ncbi:hemolysin [Endozoicomonas sp. (ex Bugula neritina AB1)]|nr:hemolysin [Endozoicomonas sp. (ex Bugula neritina AB1)]